MKINILGTPYEIIVDKSGYLEKNNADGVDRNYSKTILVRDLDDYLDSEATTEEKEARRKETIRHEIIHAFFSESGLKGYYNDELLVEWLAVQFPKMLDVFIETKSLEHPMDRLSRAFRNLTETISAKTTGGDANAETENHV